MPTDAVAIIGCGGHALVVMEAWRAAGLPVERLKLYDADPAKEGRTLAGRPISLMAGDGAPEALFHLAIGNNAVRATLYDRLIGAGAKPITICHPAAVIADDADIEAGAFVAAGAILAPACRIGGSTIVNHRAIIDHECRIGRYCHIAPGSVLGGNVIVEERSLIGSNATVLPGRHIAAGTIVGAGAVVTGDIASPLQTWVGVPARKVRP